jgi:tetratricopeptide (TPR) repeat protein
MSPSTVFEEINKGLRAHKAGKLAEARRCYEAVLRLVPSHPQALNLLGLIAVSEGKTTEGIKLYRASLKAEPRFAAAWSNLGMALLSIGNATDAIAAHERAISLEPRLAAAHNNLGTAFHAQGRLDKAATAFVRAVELQPDLAEAHNNLGNVRKEQQRFEEALISYRRALALQPSYLEAWYNLGNTLLEFGLPADAEAAYARTLSFNPRQAKVHVERSKALRELGRMEEAIASCETAIELEPQYAEAFTSLGNILHASQRTNEAIVAHRRAIALRPDIAEAWNNLGLCLVALNKTAEASAAFREARHLKPDSPDISYNECLVHLVSGNLREGWEGHECRAKARNTQRPPTGLSPAWDGSEPLAGRSIVVYSEQGLGDTIQFARYIPLLAERGAQVHAVVQPSLQSLIGRIEGVRSVGSLDGAWPDCDFNCALLSLPRAFGTDLSSIPATVPYLVADHERIEKTAVWMGSAGKRRMGAVWSGNPAHANDRNRSLPLSVLSPVLTSAVPGWASLQKSLRPAEAEILRAAGAIELSGQLVDFEDTAAVLSQLDLVISVDTSVAHLAGAMGIATWILLPYAPDWRWFLDRDDSPWYPTVRLFRQTRPGDWSSVMARLAKALENDLPPPRGKIAP